MSFIVLSLRFNFLYLHSCPNFNWPVGLVVVVLLYWRYWVRFLFATNVCVMSMITNFIFISVCLELYKYDHQLSNTHRKSFPYFEDRYVKVVEYYIIEFYLPFFLILESIPSSPSVRPALCTTFTHHLASK